MLFRWRIHHAEGRFHAINDILNETHFEKLEKRDNKTKKTTTTWPVSCSATVSEQPWQGKPRKSDVTNWPELAGSVTRHKVIRYNRPRGERKWTERPLQGIKGAESSAARREAFKSTRCISKHEERKIAFRWVFFFFFSLQCLMGTESTFLSLLLSICKP